MVLTPEQIKALQEGTPPKGGAIKDIWFDSTPRPMVNGAPLIGPYPVERNVKTEDQMYNQVFALAALPNAGQKGSPYYQLVSNLYNANALSTIKAGANPNSVVSAVELSMKMYQASVYSGEYSYTDWLNFRGQSGTRPEADTNGGSGSAGGPFRNVTTQLSNVNDSETTLNSALGEYLGRRATDKEIARFQKALNKQELKNPTVDTGVTSASGTTSQRDPGFSGQAMMADDFAKSRTDYAETTAATTLMSIMESAITESSPTKKLEGFIDDGRK